MIIATTHYSAVASWVRWESFRDTSHAHSAVQTSLSSGLMHRRYIARRRGSTTYGKTTGIANTIATVNVEQISRVARRPTALLNAFYFWIETVSSTNK